MIKYLLIVLCVWASVISLVRSQSTIKSPGEFLTYDLGTRFTSHHLLVDYFQYAAASSTKIKLIEYGRTYELRPLIAAIVSSPQNMTRLDEIRQNNLRRTGMSEGDVRPENIAIVHLSYSVHGNEAAGSESSMAVLYELVKGGDRIDQWLANTIVIIDPCLNPDGYSRFSSWSNMVSNIPNDPRMETREHHEPWPGGRVNHYYYDLNRDWAWQTQKESTERIAFYLQWMPHVHADIHEMGPESPYYFAPAAQPYHPYISPWQSAFQITIGKNHAKYFDQEGWRYYTKESFDLFYPSYGDTYPAMSGAIGMTYEQGGGGRGNRAVLLSSGDTLTLTERIAHHLTTSLSTIEVSSNHAGELVKEFESYFNKSISEPPGKYKSYIIKKTNPAGRIKDLTTLMDKQGIRYGVSDTDTRAIRGFSYLSGENSTFSSLKGDLIIPASQPRAVLIQALFEPEAALGDSITYDITAWSVPMAYGLDAYATEEKLQYSSYTPPKGTIFPADARPYAYAMQWGSFPSTQLLAKLVSSGIIARYARSEFTINDITYPKGTVLFMRADNRKHSSFDDIIRQAASSSVVPFGMITTGFVQSGKDLGSDDYLLVRRPEVVSIAGNGVSPQSIGQIWHLFEQELKYPIHLVDAENVDEINLTNYNVLILPEGYYDLDSDFLLKIKTWVRSGGQLIAIGSGIGRLAGKEGFSIKSQSVDDSLLTGKEPVLYPETYISSDRKSVSGDISGAVFQTKIDQTNPLSFGLGPSYLTLKTNSSTYSWLPADGNAIFLDQSPKHYGFAGAKAMEKMNKSLVAGSESMGNGNVIYLVDNPLFRSFWNSGKILFSNALFF